MPAYSNVCTISRVPFQGSSVILPADCQSFERDALGPMPSFEREPVADSQR